MVGNVRVGESVGEVAVRVELYQQFEIFRCESEN